MAPKSRHVRSTAGWPVAVGCAVVAAGLLSGCYESGDVTVVEPGVYKGKTDPLLAKMNQPEHQGQLDDRFRRVQTDR